MKKYLVLFLFTFLINSASAQLANGSTAPDFTFTDINGNTQNLYTYLDEGKYVAIDVFTTWCHPCWNYDTSGVMNTLYTLHDSPGDKVWKVLAIEADANTTIADIQGTGTNTVGNWQASTLFPIMNPSGIPLNDFLSSYAITYYPTLYLICPNKKVYQDTLNVGVKPSVTTWEYVAANRCDHTGIDDLKDANPLTIYPNPARENITLYFSLNNSADINLSISNIVGQTVAHKDFGGLHAGDHALKYDISTLDPGIYFFTVTSDSNRCIRKKIVVL
jgi:thiol-disulfide isomerase/thioredoxin